MTTSAGHRWRRAVWIGPCFVLLVVVVLGAWSYARQQLAEHSNPFESTLLMSGMSRADLLAVYGTPDQIKQTPDGSYERMTYRRGEYSIELVLFHARLETWRESGPSRIRGHGKATGCCL